MPPAVENLPAKLPAFMERFPPENGGLIRSLRIFQSGCKDVVGMASAVLRSAGFHFLPNFPVDREIWLGEMRSVRDVSMFAI
jgi:hypothetical protein